MPQIRQAIQDGVTQYKMQSFDQALAELVQQGTIAIDDAVRYATSPNELKLHFSGINDASNRAWKSVELGAIGQRDEPGAANPASGAGSAPAAAPGAPRPRSDGTPLWMERS
jgi:hypothetical protein